MIGYCAKESLISEFSCGCGRLGSAHTQIALSRFTISMVKDVSVGGTQQKWNIQQHTHVSPTGMK